jgi:hypothetical protein
VGKVLGPERWRKGRLVGGFGEEVLRAEAVGQALYSFGLVGGDIYGTDLTNCP